MFQGMEYVYEVYKEKSFSKAAQNLFISQPSLSANVKRIEKKVGYPIFDRSTKPMGLTECGEKYIQCVEKMHAAEIEFSNFVNDWIGLKTGSLILGGSSLYSSWILPQLMGEFSRKYPLVKLVLIEESTGKLEELLKLVWKKNPGARIVATAVALETVGELARLCKRYGGEGVCLTAAQTRSAGSYTLMQGQNPIYLFTFPGRENHEV